jgi:predicted enzyme related to lactoylglutathione lyase
MTAPIVHFDISGPDEAPLRRFYADAFGWGVAAQGPGYALVATPDGGPDGAIVEQEDASLALGVGVDDLDAAVAAVERLGGTVLMPPTDNGWVRKALVTDPAGNRLSLIAKS